MATSKRFQDLADRESKVIMQTYGRYPVAVESGEGARVRDVDGREYVDLLAGIAVTSLGHANPELVDTLTTQASKLWHVSNLLYQEPQVELAERLVATTDHMSRCFFCNSGAEANETLIKLARRYSTRVLNRPNAHDIITLSGCFHGRTFGALAATGRGTLSDGFEPLPEGFKQVPAGDLEALDDAMDGNTCCVLLEVVQGEGGVIALDDDYVRSVEALCRRKGVLFACDEVQAGMCRSGAFWAYQTCGVKPDIVSMAKALANGLPMGGVMATEEVARGFVKGSHGTTFGGTPIVSAVAAKVVEIMVRDHLAERAKKLGDRLMTRARAFMAEHPELVREVRGKGLFIGIELPFDATEVWSELLDRGFICNLCHGKTLRLLPPLIIDEADLDAFMGALEEILLVRG